MVIGAPSDDQNGTDFGAADIFERSDGAWAQVAKLMASDGEANERFGSFLSISGTTAIVAAHLDDDKGSMSGSAYIFEKSADGWEQVAKLTANDGEAIDMFGISVSISDSAAIVGAHYDDNDFEDTGSAYVFERLNGNWTQVAKLTANDASYLDRLGIAVAISGSTVIACATSKTDRPSESGAAYIFERLTVDLASSDESEAAVPGTVTIPWGQSTAVFPIDAVDDGIVDGMQTVTITASAAGYIDGTDSLVVTDNDLAGINVAPIRRLMSEAGGTGTFAMTLISEPAADVAISLASTDTTEGSVFPWGLGFTPANWNQPQTVTVTGVDYVVDGDQNTLIAICVDDASMDPQFIALPDQTVIVTTLDDGYHGWQNRTNPYDVDGDGVVKPLDREISVQRLK